MWFSPPLVESLRNWVWKSIPPNSSDWSITWFCATEKVRLKCPVSNLFSKLTVYLDIARLDDGEICLSKLSECIFLLVVPTVPAACICAGAQSIGMSLMCSFGWFGTMTHIGCIITSFATFINHITPQLAVFILSIQTICFWLKKCRWSNLSPQSTAGWK